MQSHGPAARAGKRLDEWLVHYRHRPHEGLRHPTLPKKALTPNQMWAALVAVAGYVPHLLSGNDYLELRPVRRQAITERGIRINHRTYDHDALAPYRGQPPVTARDGRWEVHNSRTCRSVCGVARRRGLQRALLT